MSCSQEFEWEASPRPEQDRWSLTKPLRKGELGQHINFECYATLLRQRNGLVRAEQPRRSCDPGEAEPVGFPSVGHQVSRFGSLSSNVCIRAVLEPNMLHSLRPTPGLK